MAAELHIPNLTIEPADDGLSVSLEQELGGNRHLVSLHVSQVRALADLMGLGAGERARMQRALLRAWEMAERTHQLLRITAECGREDVDAELSKAGELTAFLAFICADFGDQSAHPHQPMGDLFAGAQPQ